jgi:hypothetical protein
LPSRDGRDLARVLLDRADDDITLVRRVVDDAHATLALVEEIRAWASATVAG